VIVRLRNNLHLKIALLQAIPALALLSVLVFNLIQVGEVSFENVAFLRLNVVVAGAGLALIVVISTVWLFDLRRSLQALVNGIARFRDGDYSSSIEIRTSDELGEMANQANDLGSALLLTRAENGKRQQLSAWLADLNQALTGNPSQTKVASRALETLCKCSQASVGALYAASTTEDELVKLSASDSLAGLRLYAQVGLLRPIDGDDGNRAPLQSSAPLGGMVERALIDDQVFTLHDLPDNYLRIDAALGSINPQEAVLIPLVHNGIPEGLIELGSAGFFSQQSLDFFDEARPLLSVALQSARDRQRIGELLGRSQSQTRALTEQREELQIANLTLEEKGDELKRSEEQLLESNKQLMQQQKFTEVAAAELQRKAVELEQADKYKSEFLANVSHELRTPLNSLLILAEILAQNKTGNLDDQEMEHAQVIFQGGNELLDLINDLLDLAKAESRKLQAHFDEVDLKDLITTLAGQFGPSAKAHSIDFSVSGLEQVPTIMVSDRQRIAQILRNLIANAFKFAARGQVTLRLHQPQEPMQLDRFGDTLNPQEIVAFSVIDNGIGIAEDKLELIFEAFAQADGSTSRSYGGTGLGLSICREFSRLLGGKVTVDSQEGKGSTFTLFLPLQAPASEELPTTWIAEKDTTDTPSSEPHQVDPPTQPTTALTAAKSTDIVSNDKAVAPQSSAVQRKPTNSEQLDGQRVLLVDDDLRNTYALGQSLTAFGLEVEIAENGQHALDILDEQGETIDVVLMDIMMPVMDGIEAITRIRASATLSKLPIIALTANAMADDEQRCISAGASAFATKPIKTAELLHMLTNVLFD